MKIWQDRAIELLTKSLSHVPVELNELDWKSGLSDKSKRLPQHIYASGFEGMVRYIMDQLSANEVIEKALRKTELKLPTLVSRW